MPAVLEAVDLAALLAEACAWALLTILVILLAKLVSVLHFKIDIVVATFEPLGWLADALNSYILAGAEDARAAVAGAMKATYDGLVWGFDEMLGAFTDLAHATRALAVYIWSSLVKPYIAAALSPIRAAISKAEAAIVTLTNTVAADLVKAENYAASKATAAENAAEGFTRTEIRAARADAAAASAAITARLDGIGTQAEALATSIAAAPDAVWNDLKKYGDVQNLADAILLGTAGALGIKALTDATGLDSKTCETNQKNLCGTDPTKWLNLLEGLAALGFAFDLRELAAFANSLAGDVEPLVKDAA